MFHIFMVGVVSAAASTLSASAFAQQEQLGSAIEAKVMLEKAVFAVKTDKAQGAWDVQQWRGRLQGPRSLSILL